jgi:hypothetical protein
MKVLRIGTAFAVALLACSVPQATAQNAPPGNSEVDQYFETVPNGSGNVRPRRGEPGGGSPALSAATRRELERLGADGHAVADLVESNRTDAARSAGSVRKADDESSILPALQGAVNGSNGQGLGLMFPLLLLGTLICAVFSVRRQRRRAG